MNVQTAPEHLKPADYASDQEVRWCPGCGDYAILKAVQKTVAELELKPENTCFVSGIGCAARFPYYMATYGFHTIHGRAPTFATGAKMVNPDLDIWLVMGDGDALSIGGNHTLHVLRRNLDIQMLLFNNAIYGLTKGQYSPTSQIGTRSPSTPQGSIDSPLNPTVFALGAGARFVARSYDTNQKHLPEMLKRAHQHKGASFVEIIQNCIVYNDGVFENWTSKKVATETQIVLQHGKPLLFGADNAKGLRLKPGTMELEVVTIGEAGITEGDVLVHDETNRAAASLLGAMAYPEFPVAIGVLYCNPAPTYDGAVREQDEATAKMAPATDLNALLRAGRTWTVAPD
jgi:2-oxoglutarate/2-oxoacid ferredoxin oxidoreductase subunit beta